MLLLYSCIISFVFFDASAKIDFIEETSPSEFEDLIKTTPSLLSNVEKKCFTKKLLDESISIIVYSFP